MSSQQTLTSNELLCLGLITSSKFITSMFGEPHTKPKNAISGKKLEEITKKKPIQEWTTIGKSSIYAILKRLEERLLIQGNSETTGIPPVRTVYYNITNKGLELLKQEVKLILSKFTFTLDIFTIACGFSHVFSTSELIVGLEQRLKDIQERIEFSQEKIIEAHTKERIPPFIFQKLFERGQQHAKTEIKWLEQLISELNQKLKDQ
ncbi:MAG: hypothetical protein ACXAC7_02830 [Candidatus Hodarchaeales archaeon]|jgi:DNA-binding PadR family transcriptional regulator